MPGCNECKYKKSKLDDLKINRKCLLGFDKKMNEWWSKNGHKINEDLDDMDCHEYSDDVKVLNDLNKKASELLKKLKKYE